MKASVLIFAALLLAAPQRAAAVGEMNNGQVAVARWAGNAQGQVSAGGGFSLNTSVGEAAYAGASAGGFAVNPGYMKLAAQPGSVVSITAATKSTGSLELAWLAPGADGFLGSVNEGIYRLDYSSDPAHAFAPTVFRTEFSTSVTPGSPQRLVLEGLQPNTTYYSRIYLGDAGKVMAGDSALSAEATLSDLPIAPFFSAVSPDRVTISWLLPPGGAAGYSTDASTTSFGILSPGGTITTAATADGLQVNLQVTGLSPCNRYYFRVASLNWQGERNFTTLITTVTYSNVCVAPAADLAAAVNALSRGVTLTWVNPSAPSPEGVVITLSTSPTAAEMPDGAEFAPGQVLADGSIVRSTQAAAALNDSGLTLDTTYFYHLMVKYSGPVYSVGISTGVFLDLPPMAPAGLAAAMNPDRTAVTLSWKPVTSNLDGSGFGAADAPREVELSHYRVDKSSSVGAPAWIAVATLPITAQNYVEAVASGDPAYIYRITAVDSLGTEDNAMCVDTDQAVYVFSSDQVARLKIPASLAGELLAANNPSGSDVLLRGYNEGADAPKNIFNSVRFAAVSSPGNQPLEHSGFSRPELSVSVRYEVAGSNIVPSAASPQGTISAASAAQRLGLYWNNGEKYVKLYGKVDTINQLVTVQTAMTGSYQIRALYRDAGVHFDVSGLSNRAITPNGDGLNDTAVFTFDNPRDSAYSGKIFSLNGAFVADMTRGPVGNSLQWDGKAGGRPVSGGAYVYQVKAEEKIFNGTLLVIR
ncbi:MAG TPA: hypothetical protein DCZ92_09025 [Elusimicrobia bacterium]|nr:hypothetical protein [Elusimicrobiota bacterium]